MPKHTKRGGIGRAKISSNPKCSFCGGDWDLYIGRIFVKKRFQGAFRISKIVRICVKCRKKIGW